MAKVAKLAGGPRSFLLCEILRLASIRLYASVSLASPSKSVPAILPVLMRFGSQFYKDLNDRYSIENELSVSRKPFADMETGLRPDWYFNPSE